MYSEDRGFVLIHCQLVYSEIELFYEQSLKFKKFKYQKRAWHKARFLTLPYKQAPEKQENFIED